LSGKKSREGFCRFNDGTVSSDIGLATQSIVCLSSAEHTRDTIQGKYIGLLICQSLVEVWVDGGLDRGDQGFPGKQGDFFVRGGSNLSDNVSIGNDLSP
jgi:hypothetical protein